MQPVHCVVLIDSYLTGLKSLGTVGVWSISVMSCCKYEIAESISSLPIVISVISLIIDLSIRSSFKLCAPEQKGDNLQVIAKFINPLLLRVSTSFCSSLVLSKLDLMLNNHYICYHGTTQSVIV